MPRLYKKNCNNCRKYYERNGSYFCSRACYYKSSQKRKRFIENNPSIGGKKGRHWKLSEKTKEKHHKRIGILSNQWGRKHTDIAKKKMSLKKRGKRTGILNNFWKGGITKLQIQIRSSWEYKKWRSDIYFRDNWTCQTCNSRGRGNLEAHHINAMSKILEENKIEVLKEAINCKELWDTNNGNTLCIYCHKLTNNYAGKAL